jgi:uncharacterized protein YndB with AHSA1/START domain
MMREHDLIDPVVRKIYVDVDPDAAFRLFTEGMGEWWPLHTHSIAVDTFEGKVNSERLVFEARPGGRIYEVMSDGTDASWGAVLEWEPPSRVVFSWKPNLTDGPHTEIEVRFAPSGEGTDVVLEHRGWERFGAAATEHRRAYESGWGGVLELFRAVGERRRSRP